MGRAMTNMEKLQEADRLLADALRYSEIQAIAVARAARARELLREVIMGNTEVEW